MRIALDIRPIGHFGVGTYIRNVVRTLAQLDLSDDFLLVGDPERIQDIANFPPNFRVVECRERSDTARGWSRFRHIIRESRCELVHVPHLFWMPRFLPCPYVVTAHDVLDFMYRVHDGSNLRRTAHFYLTRQVLQGAARIAAVSQFTKKDLVRLFEIPEDRIEVIYNAIDERFRRGHASDTDRQVISERYQVNYPFLLYAGRISPHKNVVRLIEAFSALKAELEKEDKYPDLKLIIIGDELSSHPDLRRTVVKSGVQNDVRFLGFVPIEVLRIFYDAAKVFVFPSLYEGFGLPPLEAMAHGTPVVTSNTSSLPEVVGNGAVLVNPENVFEIMRAIHRVLCDQTLREKLKHRGVEQGQKFSWETSVQRLVEVYREVGAQQRRLAATQA